MGLFLFFIIHSKKDMNNAILRGMGTGTGTVMYDLIMTNNVNISSDKYSLLFQFFFKIYAQQPPKTKPVNPTAITSTTITARLENISALSGSFY